MHQSRNPPANSSNSILDHAKIYDIKISFILIAKVSASQYNNFSIDFKNISKGKNIVAICFINETALI